jgi:hypothetical protein
MGDGKWQHLPLSPILIGTSLHTQFEGALIRGLLGMKVNDGSKANHDSGKVLQQVATGSDCLSWWPLVSAPEPLVFGLVQVVD